MGGERGVVNRNAVLHPFWHGKLNRLIRRTKENRKREKALREALTRVWIRHGRI